MSKPLTDRQQAVLDALAASSHGTEWVEAYSLSRKLREAGFVMEASGIGVSLAHLAKRGLCEQRHEGYMSRYRSIT